MIILADGDRKVIDAFFLIAKEQPTQKGMTMQMIADKAGMSRETIYRSYFHSIEEIIDKIHALVDEEMLSECEKFVESKDTDILKFFSDKFLPLLYEKKDWLKILYGTSVDPGWEGFLQSTYTPLVKNYLDRIGKKDALGNDFLAEVAVVELIAIFSVWLTDDEPEPASLFQKKFIELIQTSPAEFLGLTPQSK